jgi:hypothetical protein
MQQAIREPRLRRLLLDNRTSQANMAMSQRQAMV